MEKKIEKKDLTTMQKAMLDSKKVTKDQVENVNEEFLKVVKRKQVPLKCDVCGTVFADDNSGDSVGSDCSFCGKGKLRSIE